MKKNSRNIDTLIDLDDEKGQRATYATPHSFDEEQEHHMRDLQIKSLRLVNGKWHASFPMHLQKDGVAPCRIPPRHTYLDRDEDVVQQEHNISISVEIAKAPGPFQQIA